MSFNVDRKYLLALTVALLSFVALATVGTKSIHSLLGHLDLIEQKYRLSVQIGKVGQAGLELQVEQRAQAVRGGVGPPGAPMAADDLLRYRAAAARLQTQTSVLIAMVAAFLPSQERALAQIRALVDAQRDALPGSGSTAEVPAIRAGPGAAETFQSSQSLQSLQVLLTDMDRANAVELASIETSVRAGLRSSVESAGALLAVIAGLLVLIFVTMRNEAIARKRAERAETDVAERSIRLLSEALQGTAFRLDAEQQVRREVADALATSELFAKATIDAVSTSICVLDRSGKVLAVNRPWREHGERHGLANSDRAYGVGRNYLEVCDEATGPDSEQAASMAQGIRSVVRAEIQEFTLEYPCQYPAGQRWFSARVTRFEGSSGNVVIVHEDITDRKATEAALRESEVRLRHLLAHLPVAVVLVEGSRISFANHAAQRLVGAREPQVIGLSLWDLVQADSRPALRSQMAALERGRSLGAATRTQILRADGAIRTVEASATMVDSEGDSAILVALHDVTELRRIRAELALSNHNLQRLFAAQDGVQEKERKRIARDLHDDLQQTLAAIKLDLATLQRQTGAAPEELPPLLQTLEALVDAALVSTRRIVDGLRPHVLDDLGLPEALQELAGQLSQRTRMRTLCSFDSQLDDQAIAAIPAAVATCLYRVAQELLNNVVKHAQASTVNLHLERRPDGWLVLRIADDGSGMTPADRRKQRSLGLLGMHERVRALGGLLRIESVPGAGTSVEARLPLQSQEDEDDDEAGRRDPALYSA